MDNNRVVIFTGPWDGDTGTVPLSVPGDFIACADSGYKVCKAAGLRPDVVIGDFDSLESELIAEIDGLGIERIVHPCEKDETDTLLCVKYGLAQGFDDFLIAGGVGGDFGHTIANLQVLSFLTDMRCKAMIATGSETLLMADGDQLLVNGESRPGLPVILEGQPGEKFSVLSYAERSTGVCIKNAKYELKDAVLTNSYPIGVSNEFAGKGPITVSVRTGRLLIVL
jgi:thiamine pyrophosphokinase